MRSEPHRVARFVSLCLLSGAICVGAGLVSNAFAEPEKHRASVRHTDSEQTIATDKASDRVKKQDHYIQSGFVAPVVAATPAQPGRSHLRTAQLEEEEEAAGGDQTGDPAGQETGLDDPSGAGDLSDQGVDDGLDDGADDSVADGDAAADEAALAEPADKPFETSLKIGGALRFNYFVKSWDGQEANRDRFGDIAFDTMRFNIDGTYGPLLLSAEYRLYQGYHMIHHGYVGYAVSDTTTVDIGVSQAPFGLLKYASHNWFFDLSYYLGMEDDYDMGVRAHTVLGDMDVWVAFFKNSEDTYTGASLASARYSYDVVPTTVAELGYAGLMEDRANAETNQGNVRVAYNLKQGDISAELGVSGRIGGLYNGATAETGYHWAAAAHANANYGPINVQLEGIAYQFKPKNPAGQDNTFVVMGAYDFPYMVASKGYLVLANVAYTLPMKNAGPISSLTFYNDYSVLLKPEDGFESSHQNVLGTLISAGPTYTYVDVALGRNHAWLGPYYGNAFAAGQADEGWHARFNINIGYYF